MQCSHTSNVLTVGCSSSPVVTVSMLPTPQVNDKLQFPSVFPDHLLQLLYQEFWKPIERHRDQKQETTDEDETTPPRTHPVSIHWGQVQSLRVKGEKVNVILKHQSTQCETNYWTEYSKRINKCYNTKIWIKLIAISLL